MEIKVGDYAYFPNKVLGQGNFAKVYLGRALKDQEMGQIAVKIIDFDLVEKKNRYLSN